MMPPVSSERAVAAVMNFSCGKHRCNVLSFESDPAVRSHRGVGSRRARADRHCISPRSESMQRAHIHRRYKASTREHAMCGLLAPYCEDHHVEGLDEPALYYSNRGPGTTCRSGPRDLGTKAIRHHSCPSPSRLARNARRGTAAYTPRGTAPTKHHATDWWTAVDAAAINSATLAHFSFRHSTVAVHIKFLNERFNSLAVCLIVEARSQAGRE